MTFADGLQYAKQNPESDFAKEFRRRIESGQLNAEAKAAGYDLTSRTATVAKAPSEAVSVGGFLGNAIRSGAEAIAGIATAVAHPIQTVKSLGSIAVGAVEKLIPGEQPQEASFDAVANFYKERYGSINKALETAYRDPVGFATDFTAVWGLGSKAAKIAGISKASQAAKVGEAAKIAPFAQSYDAKAAEIAKARGVDLPASALSTSPAVHTLEALSGKGAFGTGIVKKVEDAATRLNEIAFQTTKIAGGVADPVRAGEAVVEGFNRFKKTFVEKKTELYEAVEPQLKGLPAKTDNTIQALNEILTDKAKVVGGGSDASYFKNLDEGFHVAQPRTFENLKATRSEIGAKLKSRIDPFTTGNKTQLEKLYAALSDDMDSTIIASDESLKPAVDAANQFYKEGIQKINSAYGRTIKRLADKPDVLVKKLITPGTSVEDVPLIYEVIGAPAAQSVRATFLEQLFNKARGVGGDFTAGGIAKQIKSFGEDKLRVILTPEQLQAVKDLDVLSQALARGQKVAQGSQTGFIARLAIQLASFGISPSAVIKATLGDYAFTKFMASATGQKLLTEGVISPKDKIIRVLKKTGVVSVGLEKAGKANQVVSP